MIKRATSLKKKSYTDIEVAKVHNIYRLLMFLMLVGFTWIAYHFGILDNIVLIFGIKIDPKLGFFSIIKTIGATLVSSLAIIYGLMMAWDKFIKKN